MTTAIMQRRPPRVAPESDGPLLTVALSSSEYLEIWEDRVVAPDAVYRYDERFGARLMGHPMAPPTVEAPLAVGFLRKGAFWTAYTPARERDALLALDAIRRACGRRGVVPIGIDDRVDQPLLWRKVSPHGHDPLPAPTGAVSAGDPRARWVDEQTSIFADGRTAGAHGRRESALAALGHASLFFLPVLLPAVILATAGRIAPRLARQAIGAAVFQACVVALLGSLYRAATLARVAGATAGMELSIGALAAVAIVAGTWALVATARALGGREYRYLGD